MVGFKVYLYYSINTLRYWIIITDALMFKQLFKLDSFIYILETDRTYI